ncbi:MAG TPA: protein kinase [Terriglobales bacterium]|nr:protein kinase [Terriglobales bacterium]
MALATGTRLGPYEIVSAIGAGGMGEVYRGRDTRLDRTVAIKVLSAALSDNAELKARFEREARSISALQHPNICVLHDVGCENGTDYLVMEFLEGETLSDPLKRGPLPLDQFWKIAIDVADALDKAHRAGITHRDLKPGNIMLTKSGPKLLDFGLAKGSGAAFAAATGSSPSQSVFAAAMTRTSPASPLTSVGSIVGTVQYMAPEQIEGREADARSDIFSFGLVLYEMLTGARAFEGKTQASIVASILALEPKPLRSVKPDVPVPLERVVNLCLEKDPELRFQSVHDLKLQLQLISELPAAGEAKTSAAPARFAWLPWAVAGIFLLATGVALWRPWQVPEVKDPVRLSVEIGADASLDFNTTGSEALSPDGKRLAFVGRTTGSRQLYVRSLDQLKATAVAGTEGARDPFFSPDGEWLAFFADGKLKKVSFQGGAVVTLCDAANNRGGSWGSDNSIVAALGNREGLSRLDSAGGKPEPLTQLDKAIGEVTHRWPQVLPGGKAVLFTAHTRGEGFDDASIAVYSMETGKQHTVAQGGSYGRYLASGHLMYMHEGTIFAVPFDLKRLAVTGKAVPAVEGVITDSSTGSGQYAVSPAGTLIYASGKATGSVTEIQWLEHDGKVTQLRKGLAAYDAPQFSPDGTRLAIQLFEPGKLPDVYVYDWKRDTLTRLTFAPEGDTAPVWTPDGRWITYTSGQTGGSPNLYWSRSDGTGEAQRLTESKHTQFPGGWHPSGKFLAFTQSDPKTAVDIMILPMEGDDKSGWKPGKPTVFLNGPFAEFWPSFSPDGRWLAYSSNETGRNEIYVRPFPAGEGKWQVSSEGGQHATWSKNGKELFYRGNVTGEIMVAEYKVAGNSFQADKPKVWTNAGLGIQFLRNLALHPDGKRFAILKNPEGQVVEKHDKLVMVENFLDELRRIAPTGKN